MLAASGATIESVVKTTVFIKDMETFGTINEVYSKTFASHKPARSCVEVCLFLSKKFYPVKMQFWLMKINQVARLPKDVLVEIEAIATAV